jgi:hypothetical protein
MARTPSRRLSEKMIALVPNIGNRKNPNSNVPATLPTVLMA